MILVRPALQRDGGDDAPACGVVEADGLYFAPRRGGFGELSEARFCPSSSVDPAHGRLANRSVVSSTFFRIAVPFRLPPAGPVVWKGQAGRSWLREALE
jgi:hypothetical protein